MVGGELTLDQLELTYNPHAGFYRAPLQLVAYPNDAPPLYKLLQQLPPGTVAEFPMPKRGAPPHHDARFAYMSTFHWMPLLNGYSGFYPPSYFRRLIRLASFPDAASVDRFFADLRALLAHLVHLGAVGRTYAEFARERERAS